MVIKSNLLLVPESIGRSGISKIFNAKKEFPGAGLPDA
jgi:hypothetical protein